MFTRVLILLALLCSSLYAADTPANDASIKQLLEVAQAHKTLDTMMGQMDTMLKNVYQQATAGQTVTPEMQKIFDRGRAEVIKMCKETLDWDKIEPMYLRIYRKSLSQSEVDGMIAFYRTPAGQAVITKMPLILQNTMAEVGQMMGPMVQRAEQMQKELMAEAQAEKAKGHS